MPGQKTHPPVRVASFWIWTANVFGQEICRFGDPNSHHQGEILFQGDGVFDLYAFADYQDLQSRVPPRAAAVQGDAHVHADWTTEA